METEMSSNENPKDSKEGMFYGEQQSGVYYFIHSYMSIHLTKYVHKYIHTYSPSDL